MITINKVTEHTARWITHNDYEKLWKPTNVQELKRLVDERLGKPRSEAFIRGIKLTDWDQIYQLFWK